jgi:hypothetical protein
MQTCILYPPLNYEKRLGLVKGKHYALLKNTLLSQVYTPLLADNCYCSLLGDCYDGKPDSMGCARIGTNQSDSAIAKGYALSALNQVYGLIP